MSAPLDAVANAALTRRLKADGFRKSGRTWRRRAGADGAIQIVNIQGSVFATAVEGRCTLNVGVYFPILAELLGLGRVTDAPSEADAHLRARAAMLAPEGRDTWFEFASDDAADAERVGNAVLELYIGFGAPWLDGVTSLNGAREEFARTKQFWCAAAASLALNDRQGAADFMQDALGVSSATTRPSLQQWASRHSLP